MPCQFVKIGDAMGFICGPALRQKCPCGSRATLLCDWKVPAKATGTCDAPLCPNCTTSPAKGKDLCSHHAEAWKARDV